MGYRIDLHTHSYGSPDGGLKTVNYRYFLQNKLLDYIAITDHGQIDMAMRIKQELGELGERIIIGQEVMTTEGEIIGLYLTAKITDGLSPEETIRCITAQKGLIYIPHPFETVRSGLSEAVAQSIIRSIDIVETHNGRAVFQNRSKQACAFATQNQLARAASSDAHGRFGWGQTYSVIEHVPTRENLARELENAAYSTRTVGWGVTYPKLNRLKKKLRKGAKA